MFKQGIERTRTGERFRLFNVHPPLGGEQLNSIKKQLVRMTCGGCRLNTLKCLFGFRLAMVGRGFHNSEGHSGVLYQGIELPISDDWRKYP